MINFTNFKVLRDETGLLTILHKNTILCQVGGQEWNSYLVWWKKFLSRVKVKKFLPLWPSATRVRIFEPSLEIRIFSITWGKNFILTRPLGEELSILTWQHSARWFFSLAFSFLPRDSSILPLIFLEVHTRSSSWPDKNLGLLKMFFA